MQSLLQAISRVRFENGKTPPIVRQFLIDQLRYNDNTANAVSFALMRFAQTFDESNSTQTLFTSAT